MEQVVCESQPLQTSQFCEREKRTEQVTSKARKRQGLTDLGIARERKSSESKAISEKQLLANV